MGVALIGKDVSLISSIGGIAKASIGSVGGITGWAGGGGFQPGDFNFDNVIYSSDNRGGVSNTVTFTKSGSLYVSAPQSTNNDISGETYLSSNYIVFFDNEVDALANPNNTGFSTGTGQIYVDASNFYEVLNVNIGDTLYFVFYSYSDVYNPDTVTITFRANSFSGPIIDTFTVTQTP
jgi:hypothetical protein